MQIALFTAAPGDTAGVDDLNWFLRGHRVLTLDRAWTGVAWSFCVTYQLGPPAGLGPPHGRSAEKIDYKAMLDVPTFARFSRLREVRKGIAEREALPAYAIAGRDRIREGFPAARARATATSRAMCSAPTTPRPTSAKAWTASPSASWRFAA